MIRPLVRYPCTTLGVFFFVKTMCEFCLKTTVPCNECSKENDVEITIVEQTRDSKNR